MEFSFKKMGAAIANFFTGNPELEAHQKQFVDAMAEDVQDVNAQMSVLRGQLDVLTGEKSALQADLDGHKAQVASLKPDADKYAEIKDEFAQLKAFEENRKQALGVVSDDSGQGGKQQNSNVNDAKVADYERLKGNFPNLTKGLL
jgi:chromosome segregation ATPase